jgi:hypothetical protein
LECPSKASRRSLYAALRKHKGNIKCNISLTAAEYRNKQEVYRTAAHYKLQTIDRGDMMIIINPNKTGLLYENNIWLDRTPE